MAFKRNKQGTPGTRDSADVTDAPGAAARSRAAASSPTHGSGTAIALAEDDRVHDAAFFEAEALDATAKTVSSQEKLAEISRGRLGNLLIKRQLVNESQLEQGLSQQMESGGRIGEVLVSMGLLDDRDLVEVLSEFLDVPVSNLRRENIEPEALALISEEIAREWLAVPVRLGDDGLDVAASEPSEELRDLLAKASGRPVRMMIAPLSDIRWAIDSNYRALVGVDNLVARVRRPWKDRESAKLEQPRSRLTLESDEAPVVQVVNLIITQALRDRASDVHIEPQDDGVRVRFRIDGALHDVADAARRDGPGAGQPDQDHGGHEHRRAPAPPGRPDDHRDRRQGRRRPGRHHRRHLGREVRDAAAGQEPVGRSGSAIWACRPTRTRRTRKLDPGAVRHGAVRRPDRQRQDHHALRHAGRDQRSDAQHHDDRGSRSSTSSRSINQIQTNEQAGLTFANGLKSILRQDPDVILVGEIRDVETARIAVQSALTGHFVLSSLHATDAVAGPAPLPRHGDRVVPDRLVGARRRRPAAGPPHLPLVQGAVHSPRDEELAFYEESGGRPTKTTFFHGAGLQLLRRHRLPGARSASTSCCRITPEIKRLIVGWATQDELRRLALKQGMRTLREEAVAPGRAGRHDHRRGHPQHLLALKAEGLTDGQVRVHRARLSRVARSAAPSRGRADAARRTSPCSSGTSAARGRPRRRASCKFEITQKRVHAQGRRCTSRASSPSSSGPASRSSTRSRSSRRRRPTSSFARRVLADDRGAARRRHLRRRCGRAPRGLPLVYVGILESAELTGNLDTSLDQLADYIERDTRGPAQVHVGPDLPRHRARHVVRRPSSSSQSSCCRKFVSSSSPSTPSCRCRPRILLAITGFVSQWWWALRLASWSACVAGSSRRCGRRSGRATARRHRARRCRCSATSSRRRVLERFCRILARWCAPASPCPRR